MIPKYHIEYGIEFGGHRDAHVRDFQTDDPVACESFLVALLERGLKIQAIKHEGVALTQHEFDVLVRNAATNLAAKHVAKSLGLNAEQVHFRFGLAA
jgi:hypothetical protein